MCCTSAEKMGGKLLGLSVDKMAASPVNKMAAPRTGLQRDKGAVGSDLSCFTADGAYVKQTGGEAAEPPHKARSGHWRNTWGESHKILAKAGSSRGRAGSVHNKKRVNVAIKSKLI